LVIDIGEIMFKNYFKIVFRNLLKYKSYSFIHIIGLTIGIVCLIFIIKYVQFELSYDRFHRKADQVYRIVGHSWAQTPVPLAQALRDYYPEIVETVRIRQAGKVLLGHEQKRFNEENIIFADPSVFSVFSFPLVIGDPGTALIDPYSIVITEAMADKYFGDQNSIGQKLNYDDKFNFLVTGVLKNIPANSHFRCDFICSLACADKVFYQDFFENRMNTVVFTYFRVHASGDRGTLQARLDGLLKHYLGEKEYIENKNDDSKWRIEYHIQPLTSIHLHSHLGGEFQPNGDVRYVYIFSVIAFLILLIACINYTNLSTARYMNRLKEVGVRKVVGANKRQVISQFIGESVLFAVISLVLALGLVEFLAPSLSFLFGNAIIFNKIGMLDCLFLLGLIFFTGVISGIYPAILLSKYRPVCLLAKNIRTAQRGLSFKNVLVSFQFIISIILIISTLMIHDQLVYIQNKNLGFNKEQMLIVPMQDKSLRQQYQSLKNELLRDPAIVSATASSIIPGGVKWVRSFWWEGRQDSDDNTMGYIIADCDFLKTYEIKLEMGRDFSEAFAGDLTGSYILNQAALEKLGWQSPLGKQIATYPRPKGTVIGVMQNFHFKSLHDKIEPLVIYIDPNEFEYMSIRIRTQNIANVVADIEKQWRGFSPNRPFEYFFLDDYFDRLYKTEHNLGNLFSVFSILAVFIACLGLFGLAAFSVEQRTKEIGIRKVLGATVPGVVLRLSKDLIQGVLLANIIAWPIAYYAINKWLQNFAYRIDMRWWMFVLAGGIALIIALLTVSWQAIRAATANPVEALRYE
jgi:putative ABC transport system permease protein